MERYRRSVVTFMIWQRAIKVWNAPGTAFEDLPEDGYVQSVDAREFQLVVPEFSGLCRKR